MWGVYILTVPKLLVMKYRCEECGLKRRVRIFENENRPRIKARCKTCDRETYFVPKYAKSRKFLARQAMEKITVQLALIEEIYTPLKIDVYMRMREPGAPFKAPSGDDWQVLN